ncbi:MAG: hypothetical protein IPG60_14270 [Bacteroidetes bacterium]|nr:hypothetical protein [Bacteroidota bacterium]MBK7110208.1 hypothetical protein [Bacteroidota bacterium]MBK8680450.1 hypothetical protein [Bacteroidota bacterium]
MKIPDRKILKTLYWIHAAIRKDVVRLETIVIKLDLYNANGMRYAQHWFQHHVKAMHHHHHLEKDFLTFELHKHLSDSKTKMDLLERQYNDCTKCMHIIDDSFKLLTMDNDDAAEKEKLKQSILKYGDAIASLLKQKELLIEKIVANVKEEEILNLDQKFIETMPLEIKVHTLPWIFDAMAENDKNDLMNRLPFKTKLMYNFRLKSKYNKLVSSL